jgi:hypothetical protein
MEAIVQFHDDLMFYIIFITIFVLYMLIKTVQLFRKNTPHPQHQLYKEFYEKFLNHIGLEIT